MTLAHFSQVGMRTRDETTYELAEATKKSIYIRFFFSSQDRDLYRVSYIMHYSPQPGLVPCLALSLFPKNKLFC